MNFVETNNRSFSTGTNVIPRFARVVMGTNNVILQAGTNACIGTMREDSFGVAGEVHTLHLISKAGTIPMIATSSNITGGGYVYGAASGKVDSTGTIIEGISLVNAPAAGDIIEVVPRN